MGGESSAVTECNRSARRRGRSRFPRRLGVHGDRRASRQLLELRASAVRRATNAWLTGVRTACSVDLESRGDMDACGARGARPVRTHHAAAAKTPWIARASSVGTKHHVCLASDSPLGWYSGSISYSS